MDGPEGGLRVGKGRVVLSGPAGQICDITIMHCCGPLLLLQLNIVCQLQQ